ncbi:hypothetical protein PR202_ga25337 [Eleusine coracana subsp. coracana]|uniref:Growth-regulating factor n=1 Tax=Eleusine coracana subsp. coracana TaxID=191504 RepID=A0AAV5DAR6_ELECO|nr:hypothetical protein PR202_ga25337 [Eleusine coracana subsp. coracana]
MGAEGEANNPAAGGGGVGDNNALEAAAAAARWRKKRRRWPLRRRGDRNRWGRWRINRASKAVAARRRRTTARAEIWSSSRIRRQSPSRIRRKVEVSFYFLPKAAATAALQEEMRVLVASIPDGAGAAFTAMQLQELEQQSRVYQYMSARVPVPTHLVFPIWKSVTGASSEGAQKYPTLMGLATLCLDFGKNPEPEPGRCRRTDGKKWRCWRSTIPNEKYCERHMHRGRKRPVQLVVEDDEPDSASGSKGTPGKADDKSASNKKLAVAAPAAMQST